MKNTKFTLKLLIFSMLLLTMLISVSETILLRDFEHEESLIHDTLLKSGTLVAQEIQRNISSGIFATETLNTLLLTNNFNVSNFDSWAHRILEISSAASIVQLAPKGIVSYIYPIKGNEGALGHNLLLDKNRDNGALKAIQSRKLTFIGPVNLIQNNKYAVIARKPIFKNDKGTEYFWGFAIAILYVEDILPESIYLLENEGILTQLLGNNPDTKESSILFESDDWRNSNYISMKIDVPNGEWIYKMNHPPISTKHHFVFRIIFIIISIFIVLYIFIQQYLMRSKQTEIIYLNKKLTNLSLEDELTGVGNRRALMKQLEKQIQLATRYKQSLSAAMFDLDFFKNINDEYGHPAGDSFLKHVTFCFNKSLRKSDYIFRFGGDEFFLLFPQINLKQGLSAIKNILAFTNKNPFKFKNKEIPVRFSIGLTEYKLNESIEDLIKRTDKKLYEAKESGRNTVKY